VEFGWSDEEAQFRAGLAEFVHAEVPAEWLEHPQPRLLTNAADKAQAREFAGKLRDRGWLVPHWPSEHGGRDLPTWQFVILGEQMWSVGEPRGSQYMSVNWIGPTIMQWGTEEQKRLHLGLIADGNSFWCQGFSEPDAGSDLGNLRTAARRDGDEYVVNGQKIWTSHTPAADWCFLLARTDPQSKGTTGISILLIPMDTPGIDVRPIPNVAEAAAFAEVFFTDVRVPVSARLGPENGGWEAIRGALQNERVGAPRWERASLLLDHVAAQAKAQGRLGDPAISRLLGEAKASCEAARLLAYAVIDERAKAQPASPQAYVARAAMVRAERLVAEALMQVQGVDGLVDGELTAENYFSSLTAGVAGGSYEIQLNLIARLVLGLPRS
jgi:alkylation response protein AidB-like acyl-CoA dehydrogenase